MCLESLILEYGILPNGFTFCMAHISECQANDVLFLLNYNHHHTIQWRSYNGWNRETVSWTQNSVFALNIWIGLYLYFKCAIQCFPQRFLTQSIHFDNQTRTKFYLVFNISLNFLFRFLNKTDRKYIVDRAAYH